MLPERSGTEASRGAFLALLPPLVAFAVFASQALRYCRRALYFVDDPFISMRFAANLVEHGELSFNAGQRVEGYSNLLHVLVHALDFKVRGHIPDAASGYDGVAAVVAIVTLLQALVLGLLARREPGRERDATAWYYAWIITVASWPFAFWATAGLETPIEGLFYASLVLVCSRRAFHEGRGWAVALTAVLLTGVTLVRFEGVIAALAVALVLAVHLGRAGRTAAGRALVVSVGVAAAAYHGFRVLYFGQLLPNTFVAKATGGSLIGRLHAGASYCGNWLALLGGGLGLVFLAIAASQVRKLDRAAVTKLLDEPVLLVAVALVTLKILLVTWGGGDWMPGWRMLLPVTPLAFFLLMRLAMELPGLGALARPEGAGALVLCVLVVVAGRGNGEVFLSHDAVPNEAGHFKKVPKGNLLVAQLLERGFGGRHEEVAIGEAGIIPFEAFHVRFMDLFGLVDADMARQPGFMHHRVHVQHVLERAPAAVLFAHLQDEPPFGPYQYGPELLSSAPFHEKYGRVELGPFLDTLGWALYLRRDIDPVARHLGWARESLPVVPPPLPK